MRKRIPCTINVSLCLIITILLATALLTGMNTGKGEAAIPTHGQLILEFESQHAVIDSDSSARAMLSFVRDFKMDSRGNFYLLDLKHPGILLFDGKGSFLRQHGKMGKGPGDYMRPARLYIDNRDHIFVYDQGNYNVTGLDPDFKIRLFTRISSPISSNIFVSTNGDIYAFVRDLDQTGPVRRLVVFNEKGERLKTIAGFQDSGFLVKRGKGGGAVMGGMIHEYTPDAYLYPLDKDSFVYGYNLEDKFYLYNTKEQKSRVFPLAVKKSPITGDEKDYFEKKCGKWAMLPVHRPFFKNLLTDDKGRIYVFLVNPVLSEEKSLNIDIFTQKGEYIYRVTSPVIPLSIKDGCLYVLDKDESDNPIIKRFRIKNYASVKC